MLTIPTYKVIISLSMLLIGCYVFLSWKRKGTKAELADVIVMSLGIAGLVTSVEILFMILWRENLNLGDFKDYWITISIGASAIIWTSVVEISKIFDKCRK